MLGTTGALQNKSKIITRRMFILSAIKIAVFVSIISRLFYLQISENNKYRSISDKKRKKEWCFEKKLKILMNIDYIENPSLWIEN